MPRECWAIEGDQECIPFQNHNAWPLHLGIRHRRPELGPLPWGAIGTHETWDAARRPCSPKRAAVGIRFFDGAQRPEELRDKVLVWVWTVLSKSRGILRIDSSRPMIHKSNRTSRESCSAPSHRRNRNCARVCYRHRRQREWRGAKTIRSSRELKSSQCHCGLFSTPGRCVCKLYSSTGRRTRRSSLRGEPGDVLKFRAHRVP